MQLDGGCENANKALLGVLELLVMKRLVRVVWYTRLPPGHTHEDIDAVFGVISVSLRLKQILSLKAFNEELLKALGAEVTYSKLQITIEDVYVIPGYTDWISPYLGKFSYGFKTEKAQLQFRFEAVEISEPFPLGAKVTWRAYSSDHVIEFEKKDPEQCVTAIGKATGLEPIQVFCTWSPAAHETIERSVEGIYLLKRMPFVDNRERANDVILIEPSKLKDLCIQSIQKCVQKVQQKLFNCKNVVEEWTQWSANFCPKDYNGRGYALMLLQNGFKYVEPLRQTCLYQENAREEIKNWKKNLTRHSLVDANFKFPEVFAMACNPIETDFTKPNRPRAYAVSSQDLVEVYSLTKISSYFRF